MSAGLEVTAVTDASAGRLRECEIVARPASTGDDPSRSVIVEGWILGRDVPVVAVEFFEEHTSLGQVPIDIERPESAASSPSSPPAGSRGFRVCFSSMPFGQHFELTMSAVFEDGESSTVGTIEGGRPAVRSGYEPRLLPIAVTTLGRSGSTLLIRLLATHPSIVASDFDPRIATHWCSVFRGLTDPTQYLRRLAPGSRLPGPAVLGWWLGTRRGSNPFVAGDLELIERFYATAPEDVATFCQRQVDAAYVEIARGVGRPDAAYFAEKFAPNVVPALTLEMNPKAREILLVRDFRDYLASVLAFNKKLGVSEFGAERFPDPEEQIRWLGGVVSRLGRGWRERRERSHLVHYEDLVQRPTEALRELHEYLELEATPAVLESMLQTLNEEGQFVRTTEDASHSIGRWRRDLTPQLQRAAEEAFAGSLELFGYS
jgi:hypothetical protein